MVRELSMRRFGEPLGVSPRCACAAAGHTLRIHKLPTRKAAAVVQKQTHSNRFPAFTQFRFAKKH